MEKIKVITILLLLWFILITEAGLGNIVIFAPHPDDEALMFSGIIYRTLEQGKPVKVVVMTNGDARGITMGLAREKETINAMVGVIGMSENDIIFLGYPDAGLETIYLDYTSPNDLYESPKTEMSETYGNRGLGRSDYHTFRFGKPGKYNKLHVLMDIENILKDFLPDHIYVTSEFDTHKDHSATYLFVKDALLNISGDYPNYQPTVHKTLIHVGDDDFWPSATNRKTLFGPPPFIQSIPLAWNLRESINVPFMMQSANLKHIAISKYTTQYSRGKFFLKRFVHRDEIFWNENILGNNRPPIVNAGIDQNAGAGNLVKLDGTGSLDPDGDPLSYNWIQVHGVRVSLSDPTSPNPFFAAPIGLIEDETLEFELVVKDGELESIPDSVTVSISSNYTNIVLMPP